jgi:hypothetical protein
MLPPDESFLAALQPNDVDGPPNFREKEMLLTTLRFYFGTAQGWGMVHDVSDPQSLNELNVILREPGERYEILELHTCLPDGYFATPQPAIGQVRLYVAKKDNPGHAPSYHLYEAFHNLTLYVGPDIHHGRPDQGVVNTLVLDAQHVPVESHSMRFGLT